MPLVTFWLQNADASIYGVCGLTPYYYTNGHIGVSGLSNIKIQLNTSSVAGKCAMALRAAFDYNAYARGNGITEARCPKVWLSDTQCGGVTLMGNPVCSTLIASSGALIGAIWGGVGACIGFMTSGAMSMILPDVSIGLAGKSKDTTYTELITHLIYHEFSHVSHYYSLPVVLNIYYWRQECFEMLGGWIEQINNGVSLTSEKFDAYNGGKSELANHVESWAYFYGFYLMTKKYANYTCGDRYKMSAGNKNSKLTYLYYDLYNYLINMKDSITPAKIFSPYRDVNVKSLSNWISKICSLYPDDFREEELKTIFGV